ncbi:MAG: exopolysaccharide biosynthesis protein, partial [Nitrospirota bacterium]
GRRSSNPSELLSSAKMRALLGELKDRYHNRFIIVDAAPTQVTSEPGVLSNYVDGIIFVVMAGKTPRKAVQKSIEYLGREKILGIVFNGYDGIHKMYGKYYRKYY